MKEEYCGICSEKKPMKKIQSKKGKQLYKCVYCGSIKDLGLRVEDDKHKEYIKSGEPDHDDIQGSEKIKKQKRKDK